MKKISKYLSVCCALLLLMAACGKTTEKDITESTMNTPELTKPTTTHTTHPVVTMTMENGDVVEMELYPEVAPVAVDNFIALINDGFYDGVIFHRVIPEFMIQGGDPDGVGTGGPGYSIPGEFEANGIQNDLKHEVGVLSMARSLDYDSAGSQFFIMVEDTPSLDGEYAAFGKVISGMDAVNKIVASPRNKSDKPDTDQVIQTMTVDTKGETYDKPVKV